MKSTYTFIESMDSVLNIETKKYSDLSDQNLRKVSGEETAGRFGNNFGQLNAFFGLKHSKESKQKMSSAAKNRPCNRKGAKLEESTKSLISKNSAIKKRIKTPFGDFESKNEAAKALNTTSEAIRAIINERIDVPVNRKSKFFSSSQVGKTPRELGWGYV